MKRLNLINLLCVGILTLPVFGCGSSSMSDTESASFEALRGLGAIIVKDANNSHPASVNLIGPKVEAALDEAVGHVGNLPYVNHLDVANLPITDEHAKTFSELSKINSLVVSNTKITDAGLKSLSSLSKIDSLYIDETAITASSVDVIAGFSKLKILDLSACDVLSNLGALEKCPDLEWLVLKNSAIDAGTMDMIANLPSLRRLSLEGSTVADADIQRLKSAKPSLQIDRAAAPEAGIESAESP